MVKIAVSSDNHLDVNRVDVAKVLTAQVKFLKEQQAEYYLHAGDLFNDFTRTERYFNQMQQLFPQCRVFFIAGNHDMLHQTKFMVIENRANKQYLHNQFYDVPGTNWRLIANNGWYDYSFSKYQLVPDRVRRWKNIYWLDSAIDQPLNDLQRMDLVLTQVRQQLKQAQAAGKQVMFITHFAPRHELLAPRPAQIKTDRQQYFYEMINAMMGSDRLGSLLESFSNVKTVIYGHLHQCHPPLHRTHLTYYNQAVGVNNKRINEWKEPTFIQQWQKKLRIFELD